MDKFSRIHQLHRIFKSRKYPVKTKVLEHEMEHCSTKTVKRTIDTMRDFYYAPIIFVQGQGWKYDDPDNIYELPGIWFSTKELLGLASLLQIVDDMQSELLNEELSTISQLIDKLLIKQNLPNTLFKDRITIIPKQHQTLDRHTLDKVSRSLVSTTRLILHYQSYDRQTSKREISPIKLVHYQENWYLDAYCHLRKKLRSFKVSRIIDAFNTQTNSKIIPKAEREQYFTSSYGIFSGQAKHLAVLHFFDNAATDAASQQWHPKQQSQWIDNVYQLKIPYNDDRELIQEILKYADNVRIIAPATLEEKIKQTALKILARYHTAQ